ncbi:40S ribosomal protein S23 [Moesziomyces antarcticus T-34]|uniref:40S ribosomal protein S23 n=2 Tax=Pseudozyma antarctica TaxID=84753 RepID=M9LSQ5_PSEA3|nr:40S ribosomal protein S23 [Moesziomyces antarcticus T-34]
MSSASLSGLLPPDSVECATARSVGLELNGLEERFASSSRLRSLAAAAEIRDGARHLAPLLTIKTTALLSKVGISFSIDTSTHTHPEDVHSYQKLHDILDRPRIRLSFSESHTSKPISLRPLAFRPKRSVPYKTIVDIAVHFFKMAKPRGLNTARKQVSTRRDNRWADAAYKKRALGNFYKTSPTGGSSQAKGIVLEKIGVEAKQPNSAIRKCVRVQLIKNGKKVAAFVPNDGCLNFVDENDEVLISGFGRAGKAKGDIPGVRFKVVKVSGVGLLALFKSKKEKPRS